MSRHKKIQNFSLSGERFWWMLAIKTRFFRISLAIFLSFLLIVRGRKFENFDLITVTIYVIYVKIDHHTLSLWRDSKQNSISQAA